jgi:hypothetical protein
LGAYGIFTRGIRQLASPRCDYAAGFAVRLMEAGMLRLVGRRAPKLHRPPVCLRRRAHPMTRISAGANRAPETTIVCVRIGRPTTTADRPGRPLLRDGYCSTVQNAHLVAANGIEERHSAQSLVG